MHEFGLVENIISSVEEEAKKRNFGKVKEVQIELGKLLGIQPETLNFLIKEMSKGKKIFKGIKIKTRLITPEIECSEKHRSKLNLKLEGHFHDFPLHELKCSKCGKSAKILTGDKCIVRKIIFG